MQFLWRQSKIIIYFVNPLLYFGYNLYVVSISFAKWNLHAAALLCTHVHICYYKITLFYTNCQILLTFLPNDCRQITTELRFCLSHKSTVWKVSWAGTPICLATSRKLLMFSMHLNAIVLLLIFFTEPGFIMFTNLKKKKKFF